MTHSANPIRRFHRPTAAEFNGIAANRSHVSAVDPAEPRVPTEADIEHWDLLFSAVTQRLKLTVGESLTLMETEVDELMLRDRLRRVGTTVLECVEALEQLQATQNFRRARAVADRR